MGRRVAHEFQRNMFGGLIIRNSVLLLALVTGAGLSGILRGEAKRLSGNEPDASQVAPPLTRQGFTIVELLITIGLVVLLLSLLLPTLPGVVGMGRNARTLSNLRSHATNMAAYTADWQGVFPYPTDPALEVTRLSVAGHDYELLYWHAVLFWPLSMLESCYGGNIAHESLIGREHGPQYSGWSYTYSSSFLARPEFWNSSLREGVSQLAPTRIAEVTFPDRKGIIVPEADYIPVDFQWRQMGRPEWRVGFVDGSARTVSRDDLLPWYTAGEWPYGSGATFPGFPVLHTIDGVRGRDIR